MWLYVSRTTEAKSSPQADTECPLGDGWIDSLASRCQICYVEMSCVRVPQKPVPFDLMQCFSRYDLRGIDIPIMGLSAVRAIPCAFFEIQLSIQFLAGDLR